MDYKQLVEKIKIYNKQSEMRKGNEQYFAIVKNRRIFDNLANISEGEAKSILVFLNKWQCRIPSKKENVKQLMQALKEAANLFDDLKGCELHNLTYEEIEEAKHIFEIICSKKVGRRKIGSTATSKIMHLVNPELFVMLDKQIRDNYGCLDNSEGYFNFLLRVKEIAREIIQSYCAEHKTDEERAKAEICKLCYGGERTLAKIIDEYNYTVFTLKK